MTLRTRLTLFYSASVWLVMTLIFATLLWIQPRMGVAAVDADLRSHAETIDGVLRFEASEGHDLQSAASELVVEVRLPGLGIGIYTPDGRLLDAQWNGLEPEDGGPVPGASGVLRGVRTAAGPGRMIQQAAGEGGEWITVIVTSLAPVARQTAILRRTLIWVVPLAALAAAIAGWFVLTQAFRPVEIMAGEVARITPADPARRLGVTNAPTELAVLARSFNDLLDRLSAALERQRQFMADASHELRTPAHVTRTAAEVTLSGQGRTEAEYREALSIVAEQTRRMSRLIDDMLLLARADMGQRPIEPSSFYLDELVGEAVRALRVLAAPRRVSIAVDAAPDLEITADEALVRQLVTNVVGNAIRHSPAGGTVTVRVARAAGQATIDVIDQGPGVPEAERARIFERFVKRDPSREHGEGAGLGLPIARWIAEAHGGTLVLAETGAAGATFRATLPLTAPGAASPRPNAA